MQNKSLAKDYITRANKRLVQESQEVVERGLKGLLKHHFIEVPRIHDVSGILEAEKAKFSSEINKNLKRYMQISKDLRRDRELAFYGSEDLTPEEFYQKEDAVKAKDSAEWVVKTLLKVMN